MGVFGDIVRALARVLCGGPSPDQQQQQYPQQQYPQQQYPQQPQQYPQQPQTSQQYPTYQQPVYYPPQQQPQQQQQQQPQQPQPHKPHHEQHKPHHEAHKPSQGHPPPASTPRIDLNQQNQQNAHYTALRARASAAGDAMARAFEQSHDAYARGDGAAAKALSNEGKERQREMERLNAEASAWIFHENNLDSRPGEVDLHGLFVKEAIAYTDQSIQEARARGDTQLHLIVGKGLHSPHGAAKLKPAIADLMQKHDLVAALDPHNAGVLIVQLPGSGAAGGGARGGAGDQEMGGARELPGALGAEDITRRLGARNGDGQCVIM